MKKVVKYLKTNVRFGRVSTATLGLALALGLMSCEPDMCEDCYSYTYSDGTIEWMCVEYECSTPIY